MLTQHQRIAVRRHLGVPFAGTAQAGRLFGWRFEIHVEDLEFKMSNMQPAEEQILTGVAMGSYRIGGAPVVGDVLSFAITDANGQYSATYTVTESDLNPQSNPVNPSEAAPTFSIALGAARALGAAGAQNGYSAAGVMPADLFSPQYMNPYFAELLVTGPSSTPFVLSGSVNGATNLVIEDPGSACPVQASVLDPVTQAQTPLYGLIAICDFLANQMVTPRLSLTYEKADVVSFRRDEIGARRAQYSEYCMQLERAIGGEQYVRKFGGAGGSGACA